MALNKDYNPFAKEDINIPKAYVEDLRRYSTTLDVDNPEKGSPDEMPFNRYIDFWCLAVALGVAAGKSGFSPISSGQKHRFITGSILQNDIQRIEYLMLVAISHSGDAYIVSRPKDMMAIAEAYAAGGIGILLELLKEGHQPALLNLTRGLISRLEDDLQVTSMNPK
jgi:hypothetical protein